MMNKVIRPIATLLLGALLLSCGDFGDMNVDPNKVVTAQPQHLLTNTSWLLFRWNDKDPLYVTRMLVQSDGASTLQYQKWARGDFAAYNLLRDVQKMLEEGDKASQPAYVAIAHMYRAMYFTHLTMMFGNVPYTEAGKAETEALFQPKYDSQETVIAGIRAELKEAAEIMAPIASQGHTISGDIVYGGNATLWLKAINSYRLKFLMLLSNKVDNDPTIIQEFASIYQSGIYIRSLDESFTAEYLDIQGNRYPLFNDSGFGSGMFVDGTFVQLLADRRDPRLFTFVTRTKQALEQGLPVDDFSGYRGGDPIAEYQSYLELNTQGLISKPHDRYYRHATNEPKLLINYSEIELVIAEAIVRGWISGDASEHYASAIRASFDFYAKYAPEYASYLTSEAADKYIAGDLVSLDKASTTEAKIERILIQVYLMTYFQDTWIGYWNYLRTGYPQFRMAPGAKMPNRFMYPSSEINNNTANMQQAINAMFPNGGGSESTFAPYLWWLD